MARYFNIMAELRGCYADNESAFILRAATRRELKATLESEARELRDAGAIGLNKRAVANLAARAWRRKGQGYLSDVAPFKYPSQGAYCMGLMVNPATRADWKEWNNREYE